MKLYNYALAAFLGLSAMSLTSCEDRLELTNPNQQTTDKFTSDDLEECVIAAYNHIRIEGSTGRVGYTIDLTRGDEVWNSSQVWYLEFDNFNAPITNDIIEWPWREAYYTINVCNFILSRTGNDDANLSEAMKRIKGQALFLRAFSYFNLAGYYQDVPLITDYDTYSTLDGLYGKNNSYDEVLDQVEADFKEAMTLLPSRDEGGEWAKGRATCGSAAGYYARALMQRHKYSEALTVLKDIIGKKYGKYDLVANYGDNFREGSAYENNIESLFEVQYLDYGTQGTDDEWTPVNTSPNATQGHAVESNFCPGDFGGWQISLLRLGSTTSSRASAQQQASSIHVSTGHSAHTRTTGKVLRMATLHILRRLLQTETSLPTTSMAVYLLPSGPISVPMFAALLLQVFTAVSTSV